MRLVGVVLIALTAGCSAVVEDDMHPPPAEGAAPAVHGEVSVDSLATDRGATKTRVSARFVRVSGGIEPATADEVVGAPRFDVSAPLGCGPIDESHSTVDATEGSIELLDVGDMLLTVVGDAQAPVTELPLAARAFPDVADLVSGVIYTSRDGSEPLPGGGTFLIETTGSPEMESFTLEADAPATPELVSIGYLGEAIYSGEAMPIVWEPGHPEAGDRIYVDLGAGTLATRCVFEDDGHGVIPARHLDFEGGTLLDVELHRHRRTHPEVEVLDEALVDFDLAVATQVAVTD